MNILHLLSDGPADLPERIIRVQEQEHNVTVIDLTKAPVDYARVVGEIVACDLVISW